MSRGGLSSSGRIQKKPQVGGAWFLRLTAISLIVLAFSICSTTSGIAQTVSVSPNPACVNTPVTVTVTVGSCGDPSPSAQVGSSSVTLSDNHDGTWSGTITITTASTNIVTGSDGCNPCPTNTLFVFKFNGLNVTGATSIDGTNYAAVKTPTNNYVTITANVTPNYTNAAALITWNTNASVTAVSTNPLQVQVSTTISAQTPVTATCCSATFSNDVWILWGSVQILTNGTNPPNSPAMPAGVPGGNLLGVQYATGSNYAVGKICAIGNITPAGVHNIITNGWNINVQRKIGLDFGDGLAVPAWTFTNWTSDPTITTNIPDTNDNLYLIDGPNIGQFAPYTNSYETYRNFYDYFTWNGQICCNSNNYWQFQGRWKSNQAPQITLVNVAGGTNGIPTSPYYPAP